MVFVHRGAGSTIGCHVGAISTSAGRGGTSDYISCLRCHRVLKKKEERKRKEGEERGKEKRKEKKDKREERDKKKRKEEVVVLYCCRSSRPNTYWLIH